MDCPHCHKDLPSHTCPACKEQTPALGKYCCHCGSTIPQTSQSDHREENDDFSSRVLCSDGTCIGVINKEGVCNECGQPYTGEAE